MILGIDFDGTLVEHKFPDIGRENPEAFRWLREFQEAGAKLILHTMRSDLIAESHSAEGHKADRAYLTEAVEYCRARGVEFWGVNQNPDQHKWTLSPKPYAHVYVDDASFNCPLRDAFQSRRKMVDWRVVGPAVMEMLKEHTR